MSEGLTRLNMMSRDHAIVTLLACCGSRAWAEHMADARPFTDRDTLLDTADAFWRALPPAAWLEAFHAHPRIGERAATASSARSAQWSEQEQAGARAAGFETLTELARLNAAYEKRFDHIFLICASGRTADEMLDALRRRLDNEPVEELHIAADEQRRITRLRLEKLT
jgi:OHCU decarboxylase